MSQTKVMTKTKGLKLCATCKYHVRLEAAGQPQHLCDRVAKEDVCMVTGLVKGLKNRLDCFSERRGDGGEGCGDSGQHWQQRRGTCGNKAKSVIEVEIVEEAEEAETVVG